MSKPMASAVMEPGPQPHAGLQWPGLQLRAVAVDQLVRAQADLAAQGEARHEGVHQARKRIRRVRAMLALGRDVLGAGARALDADLARLCRGLSALRDAQALMEALHRMRGDNDKADIAALVARAEPLVRERRDRRMARVLERDPDLRRRRARLQAMAGRLLELDWMAIDEDVVAAGLRRSWRRVRRARRDAVRHPGRDADWHRYRRRLRRLRQQDSVLAELQPALGSHRRGLRQAAEQLGHAQDDVLVLRACRDRALFPPDLRAALRRIARERLRRARRQ